MCTGIKINYEDGCVLARTMDYEIPLKYNVIYLPKNYKYCSDLTDRPLYSKFRNLGLCFENRDSLKDGINEHGLMGITNDFSGFNLYDNKVEAEKINISSLYYLNYALSSYRSVKELIEDLPNIHISSRNHRGQKVLSPDFHYMFTDSTKFCIVIEPKRGKLIYHENPYDVMTNSPAFESHVKRLKKLIDIDNIEGFNSAKELPGGYDPVSRFIKAFYLTRMSIKPKNYKEALSFSYNILNAMTLPDGFIQNKQYNYSTYTRYISAYDSKHKLLTVKSNTNPAVYQLGFKDIENKDQRQEFFIEKDFIMEKLT